jgi:hypothetical protein
MILGGGTSGRNVTRSQFSLLFIVIIIIILLCKFQLEESNKNFMCNEFMLHEPSVALL